MLRCLCWGVVPVAPGEPMPALGMLSGGSQETMEKLTWLASERRAGQEGESEEENSQEENSEPEEEEEEEAEGMESLQKEDEMTDEAAGDPAEKPPATCASPRTAPEAEAGSAPPGECACGRVRGPAGLLSAGRAEQSRNQV